MCLAAMERCVDLTTQIQAVLSQRHTVASQKTETETGVISCSPVLKYLLFQG